MQHLIPGEIRKAPKIFKLMYYKDVVAVMGIMLVAWKASKLVYQHPAVLIAYLLVSLLLAVYLVMPSGDNPQRRHWQSFYYLYKRDSSTYHSIAYDDKGGEPMPKKGRKPKLGKKTLDILPFLDESPAGYFLTEDGILDVIQIQGRNIKDAFPYEQERAIGLLAYFYKVYKVDCKLVCLQFPTNTTRQQEHIRRKLAAAANETHAAFLQQELAQLEWLESNRQDLEFYFYLFAKNERQYEECRSTLGRLLRDVVAPPLPMDKKRSILRKLCNLNSKI